MDTVTRIIPLIYVAGPLAAPNPLAVRRNIERARDLGLLVAECGGYPIIPHTNTGEFFGLLNEETLWRPGTLALLHRCDGIVLTDNWHLSVGAKAEFEAATARGIPSFVADDGGAIIARERRRLTEFVDRLRTMLELRREPVL